MSLQPDDFGQLYYLAPVENIPSIRQHGILSLNEVKRGNARIFVEIAHCGCSSQFRLR
jgi:hypothetical protein